ncbi:MAG: GGDEF domain-containing protein [Myxococcota bacterium]|nr:GGDEF domain-containing protein [Myxococcota bacterium]
MSDVEKPVSGAPGKSAPLNRALDQSEQVQDKVERAGVDLCSVNDALQSGLKESTPSPGMVDALKQSEAVESEVSDAAEELVAVNQALSEAIVERDDLEQQLLERDAALSESRADEREARRSSLHDAITGLPTLALFSDRLRIALAQARRHGWAVAVMFIDLDHFKIINDTHGHDFGDRVLQMVAQRLEGIVRSGDSLSRRGGDEFLFLMMEARDGANAAAFAAKLIGALAEPWESDGVTLTVKASVGIALYPDDAQSEQELLKRADMAMYAAKREGTGWALYSRMTRPSLAS